MSLRLYKSNDETYNVIKIVEHNHNNIEALNKISDIDNEPYYNDDKILTQKDNIEDTEVDNALSVVNQMKLHSFDWNDGSNPHQKIGFVADELEEIDSRLAVGGGWDITTNPDGKEEKVMNVKTVDTFDMMGYVVKAIQELSEQIQKLKDA